MRLHDKIEVLGTDGSVVAELPCHVTMDKVEAEYNSDMQQHVLVEATTVIVKPTQYATPNRRWRWRGRTYIQPADPRVRRRRNRDHHYSIELTRG